uniref:Uncharacterized protein n=1 Tax=Cyprinus carpio carpio TaxID=630221 RepID=A0A9J8B3F0_CYPCA
MCTGHCSRSVGMALIPIAIVCMLANALLLFPDLKYQYLTENHVTREAMWCSGIWASGLLVSSSVLFFCLYCADGCCVFCQVLVAARGFTTHYEKKGCCYFTTEVRELYCVDLLYCIII